MNKLEEAAELLERGWCRGSLYEVEGGDRFCAVGALAVTLDGMDAIEADKTAYSLVKDSPEGKALAEEIMSRIVPEDLTFANDADITPQEIYDSYKYDFDLGLYDDVIYNYNDDIASGKEDVIEMMKHAAKRLDS